jgi:hypothetical protein
MSFRDRGRAAVGALLCWLLADFGGGGTPPTGLASTRGRQSDRQPKSLAAQPGEFDGPEPDRVSPEPE